jgi:hypothetical protein
MPLTTDTTGLEPSVIRAEREQFSVHYLHVTEKQRPEAPDWIAFSLVMFDAHGRPHPAERFCVPEDIQPPGINGFGSTHLEAYEMLKAELLRQYSGNETTA